MNLSQISQHRKPLIFILFIITALFFFYSDFIPKVFPSIAHEPNKPNSSSFIIIGDWGLYDGHAIKTNQKNIAEAMVEVHNKMKTSFVISVGDHFYKNGVQSLNDDRFQSGFEDMFANALGPWYLVLGNHDVRGSVSAQIQYSDISDRWNMPSNYYFKDFNNNGNNNQFRVIFIDTNSIFCYHTQILDEVEKLECKEMWFPETEEKRAEKFIPREKQLHWLKNVIMDADEKENINFIFIVGHHALWSQGPHSIPKIFNEHLQPILRISEKIVAYFCGHNHVLEHYSWQVNKRHVIHEILSGAANEEVHQFESKPVEDVLNDVHLEFKANVFGFVVLDIHPGIIRVKYFNQFAQLLHIASIPYNK